jgi:hypothetical protein
MHNDGLLTLAALNFQDVLAESASSLSLVIVALQSDTETDVP